MIFYDGEKKRNERERDMVDSEHLGIPEFASICRVPNSIGDTSIIFILVSEYQYNLG